MAKTTLHWSRVQTILRHPSVTTTRIFTRGLYSPSAFPERLIAALEALIERRRQLRA